MNKYTLGSIVFLMLIFFGGCSTDVDMYDDYKDITVVYGIVDVDSDTTWIKITKAFSGPGNALVIAANPDSSNYPFKLDVQLIGKKLGSDELPPIVLDTITIHNKQIAEYIVNNDGDTVVLHPFYGPNQLMYYTTEPLRNDYTYQLQIDNKGKIIKGETSMISNFGVTGPVNRISFSLTPPPTDPTIEWKSVKNGKRYEVSLTFNYKELVPGSLDTTNKSVSWFLGVRKSNTVEGGEDMSITYNGSNFFTLLENELPDIPNVQRWAGLVDIHIAAGSQVLQTFLDINGASGSLLEEVPLYTNLDGGIGIFASRHNTVRSLKLTSLTEADLIKQDLGFKPPQ
ncbi:MAG: hypothetical protein Q8O72_09605 [Bacteroidales bacterium]|nr:hypothetical protein [Bacteroidales bacterium]